MVDDGIVEKLHAEFVPRSLVVDHEELADILICLSKKN